MLLTRPQLLFHTAAALLPFPTFSLNAVRYSFSARSVFCFLDAFATVTLFVALCLLLLCDSSFFHCAAPPLHYSTANLLMPLAILTDW